MEPFRVLIVEDDAILALDLETIVCCWTDAKVTACRSLAQATKALRGEFDMALLDVDLGDGQSYEIATALKGTIPIAFVSGARTCDVPEHLRDVAFISKPYSQRTIEQLIALASGARRAPSTGRRPRFNAAA